VATSSTEAEYVALTAAAKPEESVWVRRLLIELESRAVTLTIPDVTSNYFQQLDDEWKSLDTKEEDSRNAHQTPLTSTIPQTIYADNQGPIKLSNNPQFHMRTMHIDIRYHYIRTAHERNEVWVVYIPTSDMTADILTKVLLREKHLKDMEGMGMVAFG